MSLKTNPVSSGYSTGVINSNFKKIEDYVNDNLLNRDGVTPGEPNHMEVDLDMNSQDILNVGRIDAEEIGLGSIPIKELLDNTVEEATQEADRAKQEADRAETATESKVDKVAGKGLSTHDLTDPLYDKLTSLEGTHWRGTFISLSALEAGVIDPVAGDYADVDAAGADVGRFVWDASDNAWVAMGGGVAPVTAAQVKQLYESNPDTNPFDDAAEAKLGGIAAGATANQTDTYLLNRANHTGVQAIGTITGLQNELDSINNLIGDIGTALDAINGEVV